MAISINRAKNERGVTLGSLKVGDIFLYDNHIGVIATRNGHDYPMDLATCCEMHRRAGYSYGPLVGPNAIVIPVEIELTYKVVG